MDFTTHSPMHRGWFCAKYNRKAVLEAIQWAPYGITEQKLILCHKRFIDELRSADQSMNAFGVCSIQATKQHYGIYISNYINQRFLTSLALEHIITPK